MGHEENKSAVAEAIGHFNDSNGRREYLEIHDSSVTAHGLGSADPVDFEGVTQFYETLWSAFPGVEATIEEMIAEGDPVSFRVTVAARTGASSWGSRRAVTRSYSASRTSTASATGR